jgi:hypothetical protein
MYVGIHVHVYMCIHVHVYMYNVATIIIITLFFKKINKAFGEMGHVYMYLLVHVPTHL